MGSIAIAGGAAGRTALTANTNYYITTTGSDSNPGTLASPWATLQHAASFIADSIDGGGFQITVNVGVGTFVGVECLTVVSVQWIFWLGAGSASTNLTGTSVGNCISTVSGIIGTPIYYSGFNLHCPAGGICVRTGIGNQMWGVHPDFSTSDIIYTPNVGTPGLGVWAVGDTFWSDGEGVGTATIAGGPWVTFLRLDPGAHDIQFGDAYTLTGTPNFTGHFIECSGTALCYGTFSGAATGVRFLSSVGGNINSGSSPGTLGANFFPGNSPGVCNQDSFYDGFPGPIPGINTQTGSSYTLVAGDASEIVEMNNAGANTLTVPLNATVAFEIGTKIQITQTGAGATTIAGAVGVTVNNAGAVGGQWKSAQLYKRGTDEWVQTVA